MLQNSNSYYLRYQVFEPKRFKDLNLYQYGWERRNPLSFSKPYTGSHYLFHFVVSGAGTLDIDGTRYPIQSKQGFLICPNQSVSSVADEFDPWEYIWLELDGTLVWKTLALVGINAQDPVWSASDTEDASAVEKQLMALIDRGSYHPSSLELAGHCLLFLDQLIQSSARLT